MHLIWLSLFVPTMVFVWNQFLAAQLLKVWVICAGIGVVGLGAVVGVDFVSFLGSVGGEYNMNRTLFALLTTHNFPLIAFLVGSVVNLTFSFFFRKKIRAAMKQKYKIGHQEDAATEQPVALDAT